MPEHCLAGTILGLLQLLQEGGGACLKLGSSGFLPIET